MHVVSRYTAAEAAATIDPRGRAIALSVVIAAGTLLLIMPFCCQRPAGCWRWWPGMAGRTGRHCCRAWRAVGRERLSPGALRRVGRRCRGCGSAAPRC